MNIMNTFSAFNLLFILYFKDLHEMTFIFLILSTVSVSLADENNLFIHNTVLSEASESSGWRKKQDFLKKHGSMNKQLKTMVQSNCILVKPNEKTLIKLDDYQKSLWSSNYTSWNSRDYNQYFYSEMQNILFGFILTNGCSQFSTNGFMNMLESGKKEPSKQVGNYTRDMFAIAAIGTFCGGLAGLIFDPNVYDSPDPDYVPDVRGEAVAGLVVGVGIGAYLIGNNYVSINRISDYGKTTCKKNFWECTIDPSFQYNEQRQPLGQFIASYFEILESLKQDDEIPSVSNWSEKSERLYITR